MGNGRGQGPMVGEAGVRLAGRRTGVFPFSIRRSLVGPLHVR